MHRARMIENEPRRMRLCAAGLQEMDIGAMKRDRTPLVAAGGQETGNASRENDQG